MANIRIHYLLAVLLSLAFLGVFITGLIKFPGLLPYFNISYADIPITLISDVHHFSGLILGVLIIIHFIIQLNWIIAKTKDVFKK